MAVLPSASEATGAAASARPATLAAVDAAVWLELHRATSDRAHGWRTPVLATSADGWPDARTVVLREVDRDARRLSVYSDVRAAKVHQLQHSPAGMLVLWSAVLGWQLRCRVVATVHAGGLASSSRWARVRLTPSAQDYLSPMPPGAELTDPPPLDGPRRSEPVDLGHFVVIEFDAVSWDWLELHPQGHRRARFDADGSRWLQP
jgi:pyridoxamine 5'-phosphate oxidase